MARCPAVRFRKLGALLAVMCLMGVAGSARAEGPWPTARAAFEAGRSAYTQRRFVDALEAFEASLKLDPSAISLWVNIAEAHRRIGNCKTALQNYQRFLDVAPHDAVWDKVERRARALRGQCPEARPVDPAAPPKARTEAGSAASGPASVALGPASPGSDPASVGPAPQGSERVETPAPAPQPDAAHPAWQVAVQGGVVVQRWGEWTQNPHPSVRVSARHLRSGGALGWAVGFVVEGSRRTYDSAALAPGAFSGKHAWGLDALVKLDGRWHTTSWLTLELGLTGGVTWISGLSPWNPVGPQGRATEGGVLATVGAVVGAEVPLGDALSLQLTPWAGSLSPTPAGTGPRLSFSSGLGLAYGW